MWTAQCRVSAKAQWDEGRKEKGLVQGFKPRRERRQKGTKSSKNGGAYQKLA